MVIHNNSFDWGTCLTVVREDGKGIVEIFFEKKEPYVAYLSGLSVIPEARRMGFATGLMEKAEEICMERNVFRIDLRAVKEQFVRDFYHKLGFIDIEEEEGLMRMYKMLK